MVATAQKNEILDINEYRIRRKRAGSAKWILMMVFLVVCLFAGYFFARSGLFIITEVEVVGNNLVSEQRVLSLSGLAVGNHLFSVTKKDAELYLHIDPLVKAAEVKRIWPNRVKITIEERTAAAMLHVGSAVIEVDETGKVLRRYTLVEQMDLPLITGIDLADTGTIPGATIQITELTQALEMLQDLPDEAKPIGEINFSDMQNIKIYTLTGVEIRIGDRSDFAQKCVLFINILNDIDKNLRKTLAYVDVSIPAKPVIHYK